MSGEPLILSTLYLHFKLYVKLVKGPDLTEVILEPVNTALSQPNDSHA